MTFTTFIYKIGKRTFYGKYVFNSISDDHEGLDDYIRDTVVDAVNTFRKGKGLAPIKDVIIGIMSYSFDNFAPCYSSEKEFSAFDFYCDEPNYYHRNIYINGNKI
jgi:hypothetical protein